MRTPHPQADILRAIADGKLIQRFHPQKDRWEKSEFPLNDIVHGYKLRIKPETITINGHEVPCPVREPLEYQDGYYVPCVSNKERFAIFSWRPSCGDDSRLLSLGLIHLTPEAAIAHAEALLSFTRSDE